MKLDNRTRYRSADLERIILAALADAGIKRPRRDRVLVVHSRGEGYSGRCWIGTDITSWRGHARMRLRLPVPSQAKPLDVAVLVWLVRHEVAHWRGLRHEQMSRALLTHNASDPVPAWSVGLTVAVEDAAPESATRREVDPDAKRAAQLAHARTMLAKAERRLKLATTVEKRWRRRVAAAERAIETAKRKAAA